MSALLPLPVFVPLVAAAILALSRRRVALRRVVGFASTTVVLVFGVLLVATAADGGTIVHHVGGFRPPFAITFAADMLSSLMVVVGALMVLVCTAFIAARGQDEHRFVHPLVQVLLAGISGAFLTADVFNLFVFFEVMLIASYVLLAIDGSRKQVRAGAVYVTTSLLGSTLLLAGIGLTYGTVGTVNLAELAGAHRSSPNVVVAGALLLVAFAIKSALVPVHGWLPTAYGAAQPGVAALFSGLLTKVGVYAMYRVYAVVFAGDPAFRPLILGIAAATMVVGGLAAAGQSRIRDVLSFSITSQIGYLIMALGLFGPLGLAAGIFYIVHHIVVKTSLFLSAGAVEAFEGTGRLDELGGLARRRPVLAAAFVASAFAIAGLPPLSGFFAKLALVRAAFEARQFTIAGIAIAVSFLTLVYMIKLWDGVFWGARPPARTADQRSPSDDDAPLSTTRLRAAALVGPGLSLAVVAVVLGLGADVVFRLSTTAAQGLVDTSRYVQAVLTP